MIFLTNIRLKSSFSLAILLESSRKHFVEENLPNKTPRFSQKYEL
jgi:hypothetical protein